MKNTRIIRLLTSRFSFLALAAALLMAGCTKENTEPTNTVPIDTVPERDIPTGDIPTPAWAYDQDYDYTSSMTAVVGVDLTATYPDLTPDDWQINSGDLLGAFAGETCLGVSSPTDGLFFLYITSPAESGADITVRYYSAQLRNVFLADEVLHFESGTQQGSVTNPLTPAFSEFNTEN